SSSKWEVNPPSGAASKTAVKVRFNASLFINGNISGEEVKSRNDWISRVPHHARFRKEIADTTEMSMLQDSHSILNADGSTESVCAVCGQAPPRKSWLRAVVVMTVLLLVFPLSIGGLVGLY